MDAWLRSFSPHDLVLIGVVIGLWLSGRGRRFMGERIGRLERLYERHVAPDLTPRRDPATLDTHPK